MSGITEMTVRGRVTQVGLSAISFTLLCRPRTDRRFRTFFAANLFIFRQIFFLICPLGREERYFICSLVRICAFGLASALALSLNFYNWFLLSSLALRFRRNNGGNAGGRAVVPVPGSQALARWWAAALLAF
jgi:hypothetical protein